jgi:hypothetical protein
MWQAVAVQTQLLQKRREQQRKVSHAVLGEQKDRDFHEIEYPFDSLQVFLGDWRRFMKELAPRPPHARDIVDVLDK